MFLVNPFAFNAGTSLVNELTNLGLLSNLKVCLDAGDPNSYPGSGQTWFDLSGNGNHFYRGSGSGSDSADPTYVGNGNGGTYREYFSYDGGDYFTLATANPSWLQTFHKAGAKFTIAEWVYTGDLTTPSSDFCMMGDSTRSDGFTYVGFFFGGGTAAPAGGVSLVIGNGGGAYAYSKDSVATAPTLSFAFLGVAVDMAAGTVVLQVNGTTESYTGQSLSLPSAASAETTMQIGSSGSGINPDMSGAGISSVAIWDAAKTGAELLSIYNATKGRYA